MCMCAMVHTWVIGQLAEVGSLLPPSPRTKNKLIYCMFYVYVGRCRSVRITCQRTTSVSFLESLPSWFWKQVSHLVLDNYAKMDPNHHTHQLLDKGSKDWIQALMLVWKALYPAESLETGHQTIFWFMRHALINPRLALSSYIARGWLRIPDPWLLPPKSWDSKYHYTQ